MGMRIGYGTSAKENTLAVMSWSEVESHIRVMVENGTYMSANEVFLVDPAERERIATDINNFFRDGISEMPESLELKFSNYPASMERLCELLNSTGESRQKEGQSQYRSNSRDRHAQIAADGTPCILHAESLLSSKLQQGRLAAFQPYQHAAEQRHDCQHTER